MTKDNGGPAFPSFAYDKSGQRIYPAGYEGMSLRDWFAGMALQGIIASAPIVDRTKVNKANWAEVAYEFADAMLKERNRD